MLGAPRHNEGVRRDTVEGEPAFAVRGDGVPVYSVEGAYGLSESQSDGAGVMVGIRDRKSGVNFVRGGHPGNLHVLKSTSGAASVAGELTAETTRC